MFVASGLVGPNDFFESAPVHYLLMMGKLLIAHAFGEGEALSGQVQWSSSCLCVKG
jgi:hypothetical protein